MLGTWVRSSSPKSSESQTSRLLFFWDGYLIDFAVLWMDNWALKWIAPFLLHDFERERKERGVHAPPKNRPVQRLGRHGDTHHIDLRGQVELWSIQVKQIPDTSTLSSSCPRPREVLLYCPIFSGQPPAGEQSTTLEAIGLGIAEAMTIEKKSNRVNADSPP